MLADVATMTNSQRTGARAALIASRFFVDLGCSVNSLAESDFGFDIHVHLPDAVADDSAKRWPLSADAVHIQVKGSVNEPRDVEVVPKRWEMYLRAPTPVYIAGVSTKSGVGWLGAVETLASAPGQRRGRKVHLITRPGHFKLWDATTFLQDARTRAALGSAVLRTWWEELQPRALDDVGEWLHRLAGLSLLLEFSTVSNFMNDAHDVAEGLAQGLSLSPEDESDEQSIFDLLADSNELPGADSLEEMVYGEAANPYALSDARRLAGVVDALGSLSAAVTWAWTSLGRRLADDA